MIKKLFLNDRFIFGIILLNACIIFAQETVADIWWLNALDALCTIIFTAELIIKHIEYGVKGYWKDGWNRLDGTLVILSLPSLFFYIWPADSINLSFLMVLRLLRAFRFFRVLHLFPNFTQIIANIKLALRQSTSFFVGFAIIILILSIFSCVLFKQLSPEYFGNPLESLYSIFQMCTVEGWQSIPEAVAEGQPEWVLHLVRIYFIAILVSMGFIGMSILNSIFVDAMVSDNNDEVLTKLEELEHKIDQLQRKADQ